MALLTSKQKADLNRQSGTLAKKPRLGDRLQYLDTDGSYNGPLSDAIPVIADTSNITAGQLVTTTGHDTTTGYRKVKAADADSIALARNLYFAPSAITAAATGYVYKQYVYTSTLDASGGAVGDPVYLSETAGAMTLTQVTTGVGHVSVEVGSVMTATTNAKVDIDLSGAERIVTHTHADDAQGGTLSAIGGLTGTTETTFRVNSAGNYLSLSSAGLGAARVVTFPDAAGETVLKDATQTLTAKTLTTPTIASFTNATHDHSNAAGGGTLSTPALTGTTNNTFTVDSDNATGMLQLKTTTGGSNHTVILTNTQTTADITVTLPNKAATLAVMSSTQTGYLEADGTTSGGIKIAPIAVGTAVTTIQNQAGAACTITLPIATCTLPGLGIANVWTGTADFQGNITASAGNPSINFSGSSGAFTTSSGTNTLSGDVTIAAGKDLNFAAGAGYLLMNGAVSGGIEIKPIDTGTSTTIIQNANAAANRTYTIPEVLGDASFVMTAGAQTIAGAKTLTSDCILSGIAGYDSALGITGLAGAAGGAGGTVVIAAGAGNDTGAGGLVSLTGGGSGTGATGTGGNASLVAGASLATAGSGGDAYVTGGAAKGNGTGGDVTIVSGASAGVTGTAGAIVIDAGAPTTGTKGAITIGATNAASVGIGAAGITTTITGDLTMAAGDNIILAAGDGYIQINGATTGGLKFAPIAGGTSLVTIQNASCAATRLYTIPEAGAAASFVMTKGTQALSSIDTHTGTLDISGATVTYRAIVNNDVSASCALSRSKLETNSAAVHRVRFTEMRKAADNTLLPTASDATSMAHVVGTHGSATPMLTSTAGAGATTSETARFGFVLPSSYVAGAAITVRLHARTSDVAVTSATVDVLCYKSNKEGGVSADLCTTAATSVNSLTWADKDFTITPTGVVVGDLLDIKLVAAINDGGGGGDGAVIAIGAVEMLLDIKG